MNKNKKIMVRCLIIFAISFMILNLTGCGENLSGTYISNSDSNRKVIIEEDDVLKIIDGKKESRFIYSADEESIAITPELSSHYITVFKKRKDTLIGLSNGEVFVKEDFLKDLWTEHKVLIIAGFIVLGIIGMIYEKYEEYKERKDSSSQ